MSENMMVCPECGAEFETEQEKREMPIQALEQRCPACDYGGSVTIPNYPDTTFEVIAPALNDDSCGVCGESATIRTQRVGQPVEGRCSKHMDGHIRVAAERTNELIGDF